MEKLRSRKLWAWIVWIALIVTSIILTKTVNPDIVSWFGIVTTIYIGSQGAVDVAEKLKK